VCERPTSGAHRCVQCNNTVHAICGKLPVGEEEGYGSKVICNRCSTITTDYSGIFVLQLYRLHC